MTESAKAVFLSYASQDTESAQHIRQQIRDCALFIPINSANTAPRPEGYFRLEWDLADQRSHRVAQ